MSILFLQPLRCFDKVILALNCLTALLISKKFITMSREQRAFKLVVSIEKLPEAILYEV